MSSRLGRAVLLASTLLLAVVARPSRAEPGPCADAVMPPASVLASLRAAVRQSASFIGETVDGPLEISAAWQLLLGETLLFVQVPDAIGTSNSAVPMLVSDRGWQVGAPISGRVVALVWEGDRDALLAVTQWQVEGTFPMLFRSTDGLRWSPDALPPGADEGPMRLVTHACGRSYGTFLAFTDADGDARRGSSWGRPTRGGAWRPASPPRGCRLGTRPVMPRARACVGDRNEISIGPRRIAFPRTLH